MSTEIKAQNTTTLASVKEIYDAANEANGILDDMNDAATAAHTTLTGIYADAEQAATEAASAKASATNASEYAARALGNLSSVQSVAETLNWITAHGTMTNTQSLVPPETALNPSHVYFVVDANGDYEVGGTRYSVVTEPDVDDIASYYVLSIDESLNNYVATHLAVDGEGLWIVPDAGGNKVLIAVGGAGHTYSTAGTYIIGKVNNVDTVLAKFLTTGATVGQMDGAHSEIDGDGMQIYSIDAQGNLVELANVGYGKGTGGNGNAKAPYFSLGQRDVDAYEYDPQVPYGLGMLCSYDGDLYVCIVNMEQGETWNPQHWQLAIGNYSFAEGYIVVASGFGSHAEGSSCKAIGPETHAEGIGTVASGYFSHAEGSETVASGEMAHAQNQKTIAAKACQTAIGKYNLEDTETTTSKQKALIIGNGTSNSARSNALTVDWDGNVEAAGGADLAALTENSGTYSGGLNDEALLTSATITKLEAWLNS